LKTHNDTASERAPHHALRIDAATRAARMVGFARMSTTPFAHEPPATKLAVRWRIITVVAVVCVTAVSPPSSAADGRPFVWHARLMYRAGSTQKTERLLISRDTLVFASLEQPVVCNENAARFECAQAGEGKSSGHVYASGKAHSEQDNGTLDETYEQSASWHGQSDTFQATMTGPTGSVIGPGFSATYLLRGTLTGVARTVIRAATGTFTQDHVSLSQPFATRMREGGDGFDLDLQFEPASGKPSATGDDAASSDLPQRLADARNSPNADYALAAMGLFLDANTARDAQGHALQCLTRQYVAAASPDSAPGLTMEVSYCGWLAAANDAWAPANLPPADRVATR
jgi:hypothetical protein